MINYSNGIISKPNMSDGNPYGVSRTFIARVGNNEKFGTVQIPMLNQQQGLEMISPDNLFETYNPVNIGENEFYIDYAAQIIYFNKKQIGQRVVFIAYDMGEDLILDHKICTLVDNNGNPIETLKDILEKGFESIEYLNTVGSAVEITDLLKAEITNGKNMVSNLQEKIIVGGNTINTLVTTTNEAKATNTTLLSTDNSAKVTDSTLKNTTTVANNKNEELKTTTTNAEVKRLEVVQATNNANTSKTQLQTVINDSVTKKTQLQSTVDDSVVKNNILQASIGQADITTMKTDVTNLKNDKLNKADLLTELKKVDGSGSGIDADLIDGCHVDDTKKDNKSILTASKIYSLINTTSTTNTLNTTIGDTKVFIIQFQMQLVGGEGNKVISFPQGLNSVYHLSTNINDCSTGANTISNLNSNVYFSNSNKEMTVYVRPIVGTSANSCNITIRIEGI